jgi:hypothetical protein
MAIDIPHNRSLRQPIAAPHLGMDLYQQLKGLTSMRAGLVGRPRAKSIRYLPPPAGQSVALSGGWYSLLRPLMS